MFITGKHLSRRTVLRGVGATVALPFLEAMLPAGRARAQSVVPPARFVGIFVPHGAAPDYWVPASSRAGFEFPFIWKPLVNTT